MADWKPVADAAKQVGKPTSTVYRWIAKDTDVTGIGLDVRDDGQLLVEVGSLTEYRDSIKRGRPRK